MFDITRFLTYNWGIGRNSGLSTFPTYDSIFLSDRERRRQGRKAFVGTSLMSASSPWAFEEIAFNDGVFGETRGVFKILLAFVTFLSFLLADLRESILSEGRNLGCEACFWHVSVWTAAYHQVKQNLLPMFCQIFNAVFFLFLGPLLRQRPHPPRLPSDAVGLRARLHLQPQQPHPCAHLQEPRRPRPVQAQRGHQLQDRRAAAPVLQHPVLPQAAQRETVPGEVGNLQHIPNLAQNLQNSLDFLQVLWRELQAAQAHQGHLGPGQPVQPLPQHRQQGRELLHRMNNSRVTSGIISSLEQCSQRQQL